MAGTAWDRVLLPPSPDIVDLLLGRQRLRSHRPRPADEFDQVKLLNDAGEQQQATQLRLRSIESVEPIYLRFFNNTPFRVRMLWLDYRGHEVPYEVIEPGQSSYQHTFLTHPWLVREVTTGSRLLLNQQEAFVVSELPQPVPPAAGAAAAADAPAGQPAAAQDAAAADEETENEEMAEDEEEGVSSSEWETDDEGQQQQQQEEEEGEYDHSAAVAAVVAILAMTGVAGPTGPPMMNGLHVVDANITPLPSLTWSKEAHHLFSEPFKAAVRTFLLCHQQLQRTAGGSAGSGSHLGHLHHHLLPQVVARAAPIAPQAVHYPLQHRPDIRLVSIKGDCWSRA